MNNIRIGQNLSLSYTPEPSQEGFIDSCQATERRLEAKCRSSFNDLSEYLEFLNDLNLHEKAYSEAERLSAFFPTEKLYFYAIHLEDKETILKHIKTLTPKPDTDIDQWLLLIRYHYLKGTIDDLAYGNKAKPVYRSCNALLYFYAEDYQKVHALLSDFKDLTCLEAWLLFVASQKLDLVDVQQEAFAIIEKKFNLPWRIILDESFAALKEFTTPYTRNRVQIYLQKQLERHPCFVELLRALSTISDSIISSQYASKAIKLQFSYVNPLNQKATILDSNCPLIEKYNSLLELFKKNPIKSIFDELINITKNNPKLRLEVASIACQLKLSLYYERQFVLEQHPDEEKEVKALLEKVTTLLIVSPCNKKLLQKRISLLIELNRKSDFILEIKNYIKQFGHSKEFIPFLEKSSDAPGITDLLIDAKKQELRQKPTPSNFESLICLLRKHRSSLDCIKETVDLAINLEIDIQSQEFYAALDDIQDKNALAAILETVPRKYCFFGFLQKRAYFYEARNEIDKALSDIDAVIKKYKNPDQFKATKLNLLIKGKKFVEAADFYLAYPHDASSDRIGNLIFELDRMQKFDLVEKVIKTIKRKLSTFEKDRLSQALIALGKHRDAIAYLRELIQEDPQNTNHYYYKALCYEALGQIGNAIDTLNDVHDPNFWLDWKTELQEKLNAPQTHAVKSEGVKGLIKAKPLAIDPKKVPHFIEEPSKKTGKKPSESDGPKLEKVKKVLQNAPAHAVDPLADPLADIKALAKKGEKETGPKEKPAPAPAPIAAPIKGEPPKPIVKLSLRPREKVFLKKAHTALSEYNAMKTPLLSQEIVFRNQIYTILRVFTPLRLNAKHPQLINDLKRIRDNARHDTDLLSQERLDSLFTYLQSIRLEHQLHDWIREKSIITKLMLQNHILTVRKPKKTAKEKVIQELEFILKERGDKATWNDRLYHRNAIKASLSIIGEASNFLSDEHKKLFAEFREAGNEPAHEFFTDGETLENVERLKEEDISPEALWELIQKADDLLNQVKNS